MRKVAKTNKNKLIKVQRKKTLKKNTHNNHQTIIKSLLQLQAQIKFLHWNTSTYSIHMITDKFHEKLSNHIDELVEILLAQGVKLKSIHNTYENTLDLSTNNSSYHSDAQNTLYILDKLIDTINNNSKHTTRDVSAVLDVIVTDINRFKYLLDLK